ncbi:MAG TPA: hypothetical protein VI894_01610 [Candidatus Nanoarchaeia archaeon]|nr:hypothetical protein [Candidatus Nanoarchaeia archaeon]
MKTDQSLDGMEIVMTTNAVYCGGCSAQGTVQKNLFVCPACNSNVVLSTPGK